MTFNTLPLGQRLLENISRAGYTSPTPIQAQAIPPLLEGRDILACAQTGTGKTAAFVLPILRRLEKPSAVRSGRGPRALILAPTRELASQVLESIHTFSRGMGLRSGMVMGGVSYGPQYQLLKGKLDILVATPGRLIDHMGEGRVDFSRIEVVVLDEADRMLDMGFLKPVERIMGATPEERQTMLFSATFDGSVEKVAKRVLKNPQRVHLAPATVRHEGITQYALHAESREKKQELLAELLADTTLWQAIVFIKTKHGADRLAKKLSKNGHKCAALHGDMRQGARRRVMEQMHRGSLRVLVATDVAARGLDVKGLSHVINFDLPQVAEDYVHRIGRTGRAGESGIAVSLVGPQDRPLLRDVEKLLGRRVEYRGESVPPAPAFTPEEKKKRRGKTNKAKGYPKRFARAGGTSRSEARRAAAF